MKFAIKSEEIFPSAMIRPLSDAEIDCVEGGVYQLSKGVAALVSLLARLTGSVT